MHHIPRLHFLLLAVVFSASLLIPGVPSQASDYTGVSLWARADSGGTTTILIKSCGTTSNLQLRSERPGVWISPIYNRTTSCSSSWQIVFQAPSNDNGVYIIYSSMSDSYLSDAEFMARALRHQCQITSQGVAACTPLPDQTSPRISIDAPSDGQAIANDVTISGWAADAGARSGTGVDSVDASIDIGGNVIALGSASYGLGRSDVASALGDSRFTNSGYNLTFNVNALGLPSGAATIKVRAHSTISNTWMEGTRSVTIAGGGPPIGVCSDTEYLAQYFNNRTLSGAPAKVACESVISYEWGVAGPGGGVNSADFSVRWTKTISTTAAGDYIFLTSFDDGYRVWLDNVLVVDRWFDQSSPLIKTPVAIPAGDHALKVEYYNGPTPPTVSVAKFSYIMPPSLASLSPSTKVANAEAVPVIIRGQNFQAPITASIGGVALSSVTVLDSTSLAAVIPASLATPGTYDVVVDMSGYQATLPRAFEVTPAVDPTQVRALFVLACDNELVTDCQDIVDNLEAAMARSSDLRILLLWDGPEDGDSFFYDLKPDTNIARWAEYTDGVNRIPYPQNDGEIDTGSYRTLVEFAGWAQAKYPGRYKTINLYGHGGGWAPEAHPGQAGGIWRGIKPIEGNVGGMLWDQHPGSTLATAPLATAMELITNAGKFDMIYLDACLMSMSEVLGELAPYTDYIMAHENETWADGSAYKEFFSGISATTTPEELMTHMAMVNRASWPQAQHPNQMTVVETMHMGNVLQQIDKLAVALLAGLPTQRAAIQVAAIKAAHVDGNVDYVIDPDDPFIDASDFALQLTTAEGIGKPIRDAAADLIIAIKQATRFNEHHSDYLYGDTPIYWDLDRLGGQSLFFPFKTDDWRRRAYNTDNLPNFASATHWDEFVNAWYAGQAPPPIPTGPCDACLPAPMRIGLIAAPPAYGQLGKTVWVPVKLLGPVVKNDDLQGIQFEIVSSNPNILAPDSHANPDLGPLFPHRSLTHDSSGQQSWFYMINTPGGVSPPVTGSDVVVNLPFQAKAEGCVDLTFSSHKLTTLTPDLIPHHAFTGHICIREKAEVNGQVYLEDRSPGQYGGTLVKLRAGNSTYQTTTDPMGYYRFPKVNTGEYSITFDHTLYMRASRKVTVVGVETVAMDQIGLWAGDMDDNHQIDVRDWYICAAASIPVNVPRFDINLDGVTDIEDCSIVDRNIKHHDHDEEGENPSHSDDHHLRLLSDQSESFTPLAAASYLMNSDGPTVIQDEEGVSISLPNLTGRAAVGLRVQLPNGEQAQEVIAQGDFTGTFLSYYQEQDTLYIIMVLPVGTLAQSNGVVARISGVSNASIEAVSLVDPRTDIITRIHLPLVSR